MSSALVFNKLSTGNQFIFKAERLNVKQLDPDETAHYEPSHLDPRCLQNLLSSPMTVKELIKELVMTATGDIFSEIVSLEFHVNDSHAMPLLIFTEKKNQNIVCYNFA